ncbi:MAG: hypothetical protein ACRDS0_10125 [Pseudonocardiaceae bacterium]
MTEEYDNAKRAEVARVALEAFGNVTGQRDYDLLDRDNFQEIAGDLICDLLHAAGEAGLDPDTLIGIARGLYDEEVADEEDEQHALRLEA